MTLQLAAVLAGTLLYLRERRLYIQRKDEHRGS